LSKNSSKTILNYFDKISRLFFGDLEIIKENRINDKLSSALIDSLVSLRNDARAEKNFKLSDDIRQELEKNEILVKDSKDSTVWEFK